MVRSSPTKKLPSVTCRSRGGGVKAGASRRGEGPAALVPNSGSRPTAARSCVFEDAVGLDAEALLAPVEPVLAAPGAEHHLGVVVEVAVDGDLHPLDGERATTSSQLGSAWPAGSPGPRLFRNTMSVTTLVPSRAKASDGSRIAPRKSARAARYSRTAAVLLVERVVRRDEGEDAAGPQGVERLREEVVVEREPLAVVLELHVGERRVPDDGVDAPLGEPRVAEVLDADVVARDRGPWRFGPRANRARRR